MPAWSNWSGGVSAEPAAVISPEDEKGLAAAIQNAKGPVRVLGSGHSFTPIAATQGHLISLDRMQGLVSVDARRDEAAVRAGTKIHALGRPLFDAGLGLKNQGDIDRQSIAGALSTATHGTGTSLPCLAAEIAGFRLVTADGTILRCAPDENAEIFGAGRLNLGLFGAFSEVTLKVRKAYKLKEQSFIAPVSDILRDWDTYAAANRHFEFFWFPYAKNVAAKTLNETDEPAPEPLSPAQMRMRGEAVTADQRAFQAGCEIGRFIPAALPSLHRLFTQAATGKPKVRWSHEIFPSPRNVRFNEMEYAIPAAKAAECLSALVALCRKEHVDTAFPFEVRWVKCDDLWLSPFSGRDCVTLSVHQYFRQSHDRFFALCEGVFRQYEGRPHWGKLHTLGERELAELYPQFGAFRTLRRRLDPNGRFLTPYWAHVMGEPTP